MGFFHLEHIMPLLHGEIEPGVARVADPRRRQRFFLLMLTLILLVTFTRMVSELLIGVILGILLWTMTIKIYRWFLRRTGYQRGWAAGLAVFATLLLVIVPTVLLFMLMAADAMTLAEKAQQWLEPYKPRIEHELKRISRGNSVMFFGYEITARDLAEKIQSASGQIGGFLLSAFQSTIGGILNGAMMLFVTLYTLFFFYLDGQTFLIWLRRLLPLTRPQSQRLMHDFFATARVSLTTVFVIGAVQGALGGLAFWVCGIPAPFFWGMLMALASVIPSVGAQIILLPGAGILMLTGHLWTGVGLLAFSWVIVGQIDNVLRPYLVKRGVNLHELLVFMSTVGGLTLFGFWGVIIGPVIASLLKASLDLYSELNDSPDADPSGQTPVR
jgi:predicted PurR-regulated permease PerM